MSSILLPFGCRILKHMCLRSQGNLFPRSFSYQSSLSPQKLYPNSSPKLVTVNNVSLKREEEFSGYIPIQKLQISYCCSSGPGGQNVNKVNTKADVRFKVNEADWLSESLREKLIKEHHTKISKDGYFIIKSDLTRSQQLNVADCMRKLRDLIQKLIDPPERDNGAEERIRRGLEKAARQRLRVKKEKSLLKAARQPPTINDL